MQDDLLYATLSVHETLFFAAMLRLPKHKTKAEKVGPPPTAAPCLLQSATAPRGAPHAAPHAAQHAQRAAPHTGTAMQLERVDNVIKALGLERCRDTIIGDHLRRGVSGAGAPARGGRARPLRARCVGKACACSSLAAACGWHCAHVR